MEAATAISGCGPAFFALVVEALTDAGVREGLPAPTAERLAVATMAGTAELLRERGGDPVAVRRAGDLARRRDGRGRRGARASTACARRSATPSGGRGEGRGSRGRLDVSAVILVLAVDRADIANYVDALFLVYLILIFARILLSWIPRMPVQPGAERGGQLHPRGDRPLPEPLPARSCRRSAAAASRST